MEMETKGVTKCTCPSSKISNYPDVAMPTNCYFLHAPGRKSRVEGCSERVARLRSYDFCHFNEVSSSEAFFNLSPNFQRNPSFMAEKFDCSRFLRHSNSNNNNNNLKPIESFPDAHFHEPLRRFDDRSEHFHSNLGQGCSQSNFRSTHFKPGESESTDFTDVFDSFEMLNRNHVTDSSSVKSCQSDEALEIHFGGFPNRCLKRTRSQDGGTSSDDGNKRTWKCTTTNKHGRLALPLCFFTFTSALTFVVVWIAIHDRGRCLQEDQPSNWSAHMLFTKYQGQGLQSSMDWSEDGEGWAVYMERGKGGSRYKAFDVSTTFQGGQEFCELHGGHLPRIETIREQIFIEDYLQVITDEKGNVKGRGGQSLGFWIGGRRARGSHGGGCMFEHWKWVDLYGRVRGTISGFTAFAQGKPDNAFDPEECLYVSHGVGEDKFKWDDTTCDVNSLGDIKVFCEVELTP